MNFQIRKKLMQIALKQEKADFVLKNGNVVNVFSGEIYQANVYVFDKYIVDVIEIENDDDILNAKKEIDVTGKFVTPGFIDSHVHIESSHLTPYNFAKAVLPKGTTSVFIDPHEIGNVLGKKGVQYMLDASKNLPLDIYVLIPSCVPSVYGMEHSGAEFFAKDIKEMLFMDERVVGLAEVMDYIGVIKQDKRMMDILEVAHNSKKFIQAHSPRLTGRELSAYLIAGPKACHEVRNGKLAREKIRKGMTIDARQSSLSKNITSIVKNILDFKSPRNLTFCTDDREAKDILTIGHINDCVRVAIAAGMDPIEAIRCVTLNTAMSYKLDYMGALAPGYNADILVIDNLKDINVEKCFSKGKLVAQDDKLIIDIKSPKLDIEDLNTVYIDDNLTVEDFRIKAPIENGTLEVHGISYENQQSNLTHKSKTIIVNVKDGYIDLSNSKLNFAAIVNRHEKHNTMALQVVENFYLEKGAVGTTYSHDSHNLAIIYNDPKDALFIAKEMKKMRGGFLAVENEKILASICLPIAGMLSKKEAPELAIEIKKMNETLYNLGMENKDPLTRPCTFALIVIPEVKMSDMGLVDVKKQVFIDLFDKEN